MKRRIDQLLVERRFASSREKAKAILMAGQVMLGTDVVTKAGALVPVDAVINVKNSPRYVGRGGIKLAAALKAFRMDVTGSVALDIGASTGGFTDCLLQNGANHVYAVDVGHGQLDFTLRQNPKVTCLERINARYPFDLPDKVDLVVIDVSFIGLRLIIPGIFPHLNPDANIVALVKPQFEAGRSEVGKNGVVRDPSVHGRVLGSLLLWAINKSIRIRGVVTSPITGDAGNREFFVLLNPPNGKNHV